ncbi:MAG: S1 RNA-binding domain-containing protein [Nanoarchaeota archaeon]
MRYQKEGYPEEDDIVLCTVRTVQYHSVFISLDHYGGKSGLIHISEVSPGRIRNIREFVVEGKKVICKVLRIDQEKGHIDLSLRRVNESQKRKKNDEIKQEQRAENIIDTFADQHKLDKDETYQKIAKPILAEYSYIHGAFNDVVENHLDLESFGFKKEFIAPLVVLIKEKIHQTIFEHGGSITIKAYVEDGIGLVKEAFAKAKAVDPRIVVKYTGGGTYSIKVSSKDNKEAEKILEDAVEKCKAVIEAQKGVFEFST